MSARTAFTVFSLTFFLLMTVFVLCEIEEPHNVTNTTWGSLGRRDVLNILIKNVNSNVSEKYDPQVPPDYEEDHPTNVTIRIHLLSFDSVSETTMDYSVEIYLTMMWLDKRLDFSRFHSAPWLEVDSKLMGSVWVPDVYFKNEKEASLHTVTVPNSYMHIYRNGEVKYSMRLSLTLSCRMILQKYPLDTQRCPMLIQSYTYTTENVMFYWESEGYPITHDSEIALNTELPQFSIVENTTQSCNGTMDVEHPKFACIKAYFTLKRDIRYYIIQVYVPSILIVALSWVSFWLDLEAIPARVSLGVLTVLTLNTHGSHIQSQLPKVSYIKAIDVWTVTSLIFVFSALLEFAYVNVLTRKGDKEAVYSHSHGGPRVMARKADINGDAPVAVHLGKIAPSRIRARWVDKISRIVFPVLFIIFNICYWVFYIYY